MVYIRNKKVKGFDYAYLVQSEWNENTNTSRQKIIKYLGRTSKVTLRDIPAEYRNNSKILAFLSSPSLTQNKRNVKAVERLRDDVLEFLCHANIEGLISVYEKNSKSSKLTEFYDNILKPVMYRIGDLWAQKKLDVATEHVCSNAARSLINAINSGIAKRDHKSKVIICTPTAELHNLGCGIIESVLLSKGYQVFNISPSAPAESVTNYIKDLNPQAILISLTLQDNVRMGQSLVRRIRTISSGCVIVGGQAINEMMESKFEATIMRGPSLDEIITLVRSNQVN